MTSSNSLMPIKQGHTRASTIRTYRRWDDLISKTASGILVETSGNQLTSQTDSAGGEAAFFAQQ